MQVDDLVVAGGHQVLAVVSLLPGEIDGSGSVKVVRQFEQSLQEDARLESSLFSRLTAEPTFMSSDPFNQSKVSVKRRPVNAFESFFRITC